MKLKVNIFFLKVKYYLLSTVKSDFTFKKNILTFNLNFPGSKLYMCIHISYMHVSWCRLYTIYI